MVTGASGFIGQHLMTALGKQAQPLGRQYTSLPEGFKTIVHLGALTRGLFPEQIQANVTGTAHLLEAIAKLPDPKPKLIFASTFGVYTSQNITITESTPAAPASNNTYGLTKRWAEQAIEHYSHIPSVILRFANVYGEGMPPNSHSVLSTFIHKIINNQELVINGDGTQKRDFVHVTDAVTAIKAAAGYTGSIPLTVNICSVMSVSLNELIEQTENLTGNKADVAYNKHVIETGYWVGSNRLAKEKIGWQPQVKFASGLQSTINWMQTNAHSHPHAQLSEK